MEKVKEIVTSKGYVSLKYSEVWNKLISFGGTEKYVPDLIEKVEVKGTGVGAIRSIFLKGGGEIVEKVTFIDNEKLVMKFVILSTPMPVTNYEGIFTLVPIGDQKCEVKFDSVYDVAYDKSEEMKILIKGFQEVFISNLHR